MVISRYSRPEMAEIWSEENKYKAWLEVEILADEAWAELGDCLLYTSPSPRDCS